MTKSLREEIDQAIEQLRNDEGSRSTEEVEVEVALIVIGVIIAGVIMGGLALVGVMIFVVHKFEKARTEQFQAVADELGVKFHPKGDPEVQHAIGHLRLFNQGHGRKTKTLDSPPA